MSVGRLTIRTFLLVLASLVAAVSALLVGPATAEQVYRVERHDAPSGLAVRSYYLDLLDLVLEETAADFGPARLQQVPLHEMQPRLLALVEGGILDLIWTATSLKREQISRPIRIPLDMGLTGNRALVIRRDRKPFFDQLSTLADLQPLVACHGIQWPDTDVLRAAGITVLEGETIDDMYPLLRSGECDYLPRALNEIDGEVARVGGPDLMVYDQLLIVYELPMYLFVAHDNDRLATRLTTGLERMVEKGMILKFMEEHPATRSIFPLSRFANARVIRLENPDLPPLTPVGDRRLWLDVVPYRPGAVR